MAHDDAAMLLMTTVVVPPTAIVAVILVVVSAVVLGASNGRDTERRYSQTSGGEHTCDFHEHPSTRISSLPIDTRGTTYRS